MTAWKTWSYDNLQNTAISLKVILFIDEIKVILIKFMFFKKATKIDKIFSVDLTITTYCQIDSEDFVNFCGLLRKRELYWEVWELRKKLSLSKGLFFGSQYFARKE